MARRQTKSELADIVEKMAEHRKTTEHENGDRVEIRFIPLPPEKRLAWERSMHILKAIIWDIVQTDPDDLQGELRIDGTAGHLTMDASSTIRIKPLGQPAAELSYVRERRNFAGDCVYFLQRHFVDCLLLGQEFESNGPDHLKNVRIVEAAYESARTGNSVHIA